ncbi:DUF4222 domain-containing protein [Yokenella regensburgei]|uniref:DUF4222 domain-containing protein n=1 Tax=Yokenella regensburgei TaxID=158877 RepID=UPI001375AC48|nr:DUF4222 domain-containing protein [Yokenella regensburgei]KAF1367357.1 hypothetical protein FHR25_004037 [Yokenella regensburgei]
MRTNQELVTALTERMKNAMNTRVPQKPVEQSGELILGAKYRNARGRMVTVLRVSQLRVSYRYEGYHEVCEMSRKGFERKFSEVRS